MKALAASSIGQYEKAVQSLNEYYRTVELGLAACLIRPDRSAREKRAFISKRSYRRGCLRFRPRPRRPIQRGDRGIRHSHAQSIAGQDNESLGHGRTHSRSPDGYRTEASGLLSIPISVNAITPLVGQILIEIEAARERGDVEKIYLFHNRPKPGASYDPVSKQLLPLDHVWQDKLAAMPWPTKILPEVIEGTVSPLSAFIREYLFVLLFQACAESLASENASRLAAMQRAEKNIEDISEKLNRTLHRVRQESIDEELFDVVSGFEALTAQGAPHPKNLARRTSDGLAILEQNNTDCVFPHEDTVCNESME